MKVEFIAEENYWLASGEAPDGPHLMLVEGETRALAMNRWCYEYGRKYEQAQRWAHHSEQLLRGIE